jgi:hypothetical protein
VKTRYPLAAMLVGVSFAVLGSDSGTNRYKLVMGGTVVDGKVEGNAISGDKCVAGSNRLTLIHASASALPETSSGPPDHSASQSNSVQFLHLMLDTRHSFGESPGVKGLHGSLCGAKGWPIPSLAQTDRIDIWSTRDNRRIVIAVLNNGPIYTSTNAGITWVIINTPGEYEFPLTSGPDRGGFYAAATIVPSPENQVGSNSSPKSWYAVGSAADGSKLVMTSDTTQSAPVLSITRIENGVAVSWPAIFTGFVLQENNDLSTSNWVDLGYPSKKVGDLNQVLVPQPAASHFFRLRSQ